MIAACPTGYVVYTVHRDGRFECRKNHENDPRETWPDVTYYGRIECPIGEVAYTASLRTVACRRAS